MSLETLTVKMIITTKSYIFATIYTAQYSTRQPKTILTFLEEFPDHISSLLRSSDNILFLGDFNISLNKQENPDTINIQGILDMYEKDQHLHIQTHNLGHTIDQHKTKTTNSVQEIKNKD